jgi:PAS domain S-box-containing protein
VKDFIARYLVGIGLGLGLAFWILESAVHAWILGEGSLLTQIFSPEPHEAWMRLVVVGILVGFGVCAQLTATERRRVVEVPSEIEIRYRSLIERRGTGIATTDLLGRFTFVNEALCEMAGYSEKALLGKPFAEFLHPDDKTHILSLFASAPTRFKEGVREVVVEFRVFHKDGRTIWMQGNPTTLWDGHRLVGFLAIVHDITQRKQAQEALRASEERYRLLFEQSRDAVYITDRNGTFIDANQATLALFGLTREELPAASALDFYAEPEDRKSFQREIERQGFVTDYELKLRRKDGASVVCLATATVRRDADGKVLGYQGVLRDVTEQRRAEEALREHEWRLAKSQEIGHLGSWALDLTTNRLTWSDEVYRIFGLRPQEFAATYEAFLEAVHPDDRAAVDSAYTGSLREGKDDYEIEHRVVQEHTGEVRYVHEKCEHVRDASGAVVRSVGIVQDITERKQAEEALRASEERYRLLFEQSRDAVYITRRDGAFVDVNQAFLDLFGYTREELFQTNALATYADPKLRESFKREIERQGFVNDFELRGRKKNGEEIICLNTATLWHDADGSIQGYQGIIRDVTAQVQAEEALRESEERHRSTLDSIGVAIHVVDENLQFLLFNQTFKQWCRDLGIDLLENVIGHELFEIFPFLPEGVRAEYRQVFESGEILATEERTPVNGREFITETRKIPFLKDGKTVQVVTVVRDITIRRSAEEALRVQRDLAVTLSSTSDLTEALDQMLEAVFQIGGVDSSGIYLVDERTGGLDLIITRGLSPEFVSHTSHFDADAPQARMVMAGETIYQPYSSFLETVGQAGDEARQHERLRALLVTPVHYEGKVVAALNLASHTRDEIPESVRSATEAIAAQIGGTIARVRAEEARQNLNQQLEALLEIAAGLEPSAAQEVLANRLATALTERLDYTCVSIWLLENDRLRVIAEAASEKPRHPEPANVSLEQGVIGRAVRSGQVVFVPDVRQDPDYFGQRPSTLSNIACPLWGPNGMIGVLDAESSQLLDEPDMDIVKAAAQVVATALTNAQLLAAARRHAGQLEALRQVVSDLAAIHDLDHLLQLIVERAIHLLGGDSGGIYLYRPELDALEWAVASGGLGKDRLGILMKRGEGVCGKVLETGELMLVDDHMAWSGRSSQWEGFPARSVVGVPIQWAGEFLGVITLYTVRPEHRFTQEDATLLSQFAMQAAIAIQNARLYEEMETYRELLEEAVQVRTAELNAAKERAEAILASVGDHVMVTDMDDTILDVNRSFEQHTGYRAWEVIGQKASLLASGKTPPDVYEAMRRAMKSGRVWTGDFINRRKDGSLYHVQLTIAPIRRQDGTIIGFVSSGRDTTRQHELDRLKDEFIANTSHELRTPISSLKLYHHLLEANPQKRGTYMERLARETDRLEHIVEDLLFISRMEQGQIPLNVAPVDMNALVEQYVTDRAPLADGKGLSLTFVCAPDLPLIQADEGLLGQALSTLLTNALNYTPAGGQIVVSALSEERDGQRWAGFRVSDTGPGIPAEEQPLLFQRFFRGSVGRSSGAPGTGLGLSIVQEIVNRHGGRVEVTSTGVPGEGAAFTVWLPVDAQKREKQTEEPE